MQYYTAGNIYKGLTVLRYREQFFGLPVLLGANYTPRCSSALTNNRRPVTIVAATTEVRANESQSAVAKIMSIDPREDAPSVLYPMVTIVAG